MQRRREAARFTERALALLVLAGCADGSPTPVTEVGPPSSGWTSPVSHAECAPDDVSARLYFSKVSHLTWMSPNERIALATPDIGGTRGGDDERLERLALDAAVRRMTPIALESAGETALAERLRAAPEVRSTADVQDAVAIVESARREASAESARLLATLEEELRESLAGEHTVRARCEEIALPDTVEATVAIAAVRAGAPRARIAAESVALLERMVASARG